MLCWAISTLQTGVLWKKNTTIYCTESTNLGWKHTHHKFDNTIDTNMNIDTNVRPVQVFRRRMRTVPHHNNFVEMWKTLKSTYCIYQNGFTFVCQNNDYNSVQQTRCYKLFHIQKSILYEIFWHLIYQFNCILLRYLPYDSCPTTPYKKITRNI